MTCRFAITIKPSFFLSPRFSWPKLNKLLGRFIKLRFLCLFL
ncbi:hypothetical protein ISN44_As01g010430, partial [Arabidopsis suecica]